MTNFQKTFLFVVIAVVGATSTPSKAIAQVAFPSVANIPVPVIGEAKAYYDASNGDVILAVGGGLHTVDLITNDVFIVALLDDTTPLGGTNTTLINEIRFSTDFSIFFPSGIYNIGDILPANPSIIDIASFHDYFSNVQTSPDGNTLTGPIIRFSDGSNENYRPFNVIASVAEPSALGLLTLAALGIATQRRRQ